MAFRRVHETVSALFSPTEDEYKTPREFVEQYLPGMDHLNHKAEERPEASGLVKLFVGAFIVIPASVQIGKVVSSILQTESALIPTLVVGWINSFIVLQYASLLNKILPTHLLNPIFEPLNIFGVTRIKENVAALRGSQNGEQEFQTDP